MLKTFAVIGDPIDHSLSPTIHNAAYKELEMECTYIAYRVAQGELVIGIESLKKIKIAGFNVTIPHKIEMMKYLDSLDDNCKKIGAVNTVLNDDGVLRGFNTDMDGFLEPIKRKEISIKELVDLISKTINKKIVVSSEQSRKRPNKSEVNRLCCSNKKAAKLLKWKPSYKGNSGMKYGIKKTINWFSKSENLRKYKSKNFVV